jgi:hypothetical protein
MAEASGILKARAGRRLAAAENAVDYSQVNQMGTQY